MVCFFSCVGYLVLYVSLSHKPGALSGQGTMVSLAPITGPGTREALSVNWLAGWLGVQVDKGMYGWRKGYVEYLNESLWA